MNTHKKRGFTHEEYRGIRRITQAEYQQRLRHQKQLREAADKKREQYIAQNTARCPNLHAKPVISGTEGGVATAKPLNSEGARQLRPEPAGTGEVREDANQGNAGAVQVPVSASSINKQFNRYRKATQSTCLAG